MDRPTRLQRYLAHRAWWEWGAIVVIAGLVFVVLATTEVMDALRNGESPGWGPWVKEATSTLVIVALIPWVFWFHDRYPLRWRTVARTWPLHVLGFVGFTVLHFVGMHLARAAAFPLFGGSYGLDGANLGFELLYEARKDFLTYLLLVGSFYAYEFVLTRLQGEASFPGGPEPSQEAPRQQFLVKMLQREFLVNVDEIRWIQSARNYALLNVGERNFPVRQTMASLEAELAPLGFARVHRSAIVNLNAVSGWAQSGGERGLLLNDGTQVPVSAAKLADLEQLVRP